MKLKYKIDVPFVKFIGKEGWIRIEYPDKLTASNDSILKFEPGKNDVSLKDTLTDKADFLRGIETGKPTLEPLEVGYNVYLLTMMGLGDDGGGSPDRADALVWAVTDLLIDGGGLGPRVRVV